MVALISRLVVTPWISTFPVLIKFHRTRRRNWTARERKLELLFIILRTPFPFS